VAGSFLPCRAQEEVLQKAINAAVGERGQVCLLILALSMPAILLRTAPLA
jgi:hypothetical protein